MGGGGSKSTSKSYQGSAQKWAKPHAMAGATAVRSVYNQAQPGLQNLTNIAQGQLVPGKVGQWQSGQSNVNSGNAFLGDVLGGKYMQGNPHLEAMIAKMRGGISDSVNSQFSMAGRYGSGAHTGVLADSLGEMESGLRYQNYGDEMTRMGQAAQLAQQGNQADYQQALAGLGIGAELPYTGTNNMANALSALFNGGKSTQTQKGPGLMSGLLSAGASIGSAALMACDARLKENVSHVRTEADGLPIYSFTYRKDMGLPEGEHIAPMAQDVARHRPWALGPEIGGYMTIYPGKL